MSKTFLYTKWNTIIYEASTKMSIFSFNASIYNSYTNLPKISFIHKMGKYKAYTGTEPLLITQTGNLEMKSAI